MNSQDKQTATKWSGKKRFTAVALASVLAAGTFATVAYSGGQSYMKDHRMGGLLHSAGDPAKFEKKLDKKLKFLTFALDATNAQQERLKTVIMALAKDVLPMKAKMRETRVQLQELLIQPKIDRAAIENLRAEKIVLVDTMSKKVATAIADAGEILEPEQRIKLVKFMKKFKPHGGGWKRG